MAAEKLVLGVPLFGRSYTLAPSVLPAPGAPVSGWGDEGQYTQTKGMLAYFEVHTISYRYITKYILGIQIFYETVTHCIIDLSS